MVKNSYTIPHRGTDVSTFTDKRNERWIAVLDTSGKKRWMHIGVFENEYPGYLNSGGGPGAAPARYTKQEIAEMNREYFKNREGLKELKTIIASQEPNYTMNKQQMRFLSEIIADYAELIEKNYQIQQARTVELSHFLTTNGINKPTSRMN